MANKRRKTTYCIVSNDDCARRLEAARRRAFDVLLFSLSRITRRGGIGTLSLVKRLSTGVAVVSLTETWLDTTSPFADVLLAMIGWLNQKQAEDLSTATNQITAAHREDRVFETEQNDLSGDLQQAGREVFTLPDRKNRPRRKGQEWKIITKFKI